MTRQVHTIKRLTLQLQLGAERREAFLLQQRLAESFRKEVMPALDTFLSGLVPPGEIIRIKKLEVDLKNIIHSGQASNFTDRCVKEIKAAVVRQLAEAGRSLDANPAWQPDENSEGGVQRYSKQASAEQQFFYFLRTGCFPWWAEKVSWDEWEGMLLTYWTNRGTEHLWLRLTPFLRENINRVKRLAEQFSPVFLTQLLALNPSIPKWSTSAVATGKEDSEAFRRRVEAFFGDMGGVSSADTGTPASQAPEAETRENKKRSSHSHVEKTLGTQHLPHREKEREDMHDLIKKTPFLSNTASTSGKNLVQSEPYFKSIPSPSNAETTREDLPKEIFIQNAGLTLVIPCIMPLFDALGYLNQDRVFKSIIEQERAVHLLQFMATGETETREYPLMLNKIVCGFPLHEALQRHVVLTETEKNEAETFMLNIIRQWTVLKKTSVPGLRHNFLIRNGKLIDQNGYWKLIVEKASYDPFLLDKLPWGISVVKFRWMTSRLQVDWI